MRTLPYEGNGSHINNYNDFRTKHSQKPFKLRSAPDRNTILHEVKDAVFDFATLGPRNDLKSFQRLILLCHFKKMVHFLIPPCGPQVALIQHIRDDRFYLLGTISST